MDSEAFSAAKSKFMSLQKDMVALALRMSDTLAELEQSVPLRRVREQLRIECGVSAADIKFLAGLREKLGGRLPSVSRKRISLSTLRAVAAVEQETRDIALATIAAGSVITAADVTKIRKRLRHDRTPDAARWEAERSRAVAKAAALKALQAVNALDLRVTGLMNGLLELWIKPNREDYESLKRNRQTEGAEVLADFDRVFGREQPGPNEWDQMNYEDPARRLGRAREALVRIADGRFGRGHGWTLDDNPDEDSCDLIYGLFVVSGHAARSPMSRPLLRTDKLATSVPRRLTAVELCAGAGGMMIGMHAAGFEHLAAVEFDPKAAATLRRNAPDLNVIEADIRHVDFTSYRGVDVVVGGLPCQPYSTSGNRKGKNDDRDLFLNGVRAIREMTPRAFAFENVAGFAQVTHARYRNLLIRLFSRIGYDVQLVTIDAQDWGVPQRRARMIVVGMRKDENVRRFRLPALPEGFRLNVGDALLDLMQANGWAGADEWAKRLRHTYTLRNEKIDRGAVTPTLVGYSGTPQRKAAAMWADFGINIGGMPKRAPTAKEAAAPGYMPGLTERMRARIQGFPDKWEFVGGSSHRVQQVANAFPPNSARAVGLGLYTALEGLEFDIDAVMRTPLLNHDMVTPKRRIVAAPSLVPDENLSVLA